MSTKKRGSDHTDRDVSALHLAIYSECEAWERLCKAPLAGPDNARLLAEWTEAMNDRRYCESRILARALMAKEGRP